MAVQISGFRLREGVDDEASNVRFGSKADIAKGPDGVRFTRESKFRAECSKSLSPNIGRHRPLSARTARIWGI